MKLNGVTLSMPGQTVRLGIAANTPPGDLHHHPEWLLFSDHPGGEYAEGLITFRLFSTTPGYLASVPYTLRLTNGHLPPPQFDGAAYDAKSVRCQQAVGAAVDPYVSAVSSLLRRCLDRAAALRARIVAGEIADATTRAADRACGAALVAKAEQLRSRAFTAVRKACGADGSKDFSDEIIAQHIGLARCRAEALAAASYFRAQTYLKAFTVNGKTLNQLFPCVLRTSGEEEGRS